MKDIKIIIKNAFFILLSAYILLLFLGYLSGKVPKIANVIYFGVMVQCFKAFVSTLIVCIGIYGLIFGINYKECKSYFIVIAGILFLLMSYLPVVVSYSQMYDKDKYLVVPEEKLIQMKHEAVNLNESSEKRLHFAELYYIETGKEIKYLNSLGVLREYAPDNLAMRKMEEHYRNINSIKTIIKLNWNILKYMATTTALVSVVMFLVIVIDFNRSAKDRFFT